MVTPSFSWDKFQNNKTSENESKPRNTNNDPQPEIKKENSWGNFLNTSTYQGKPDPTADETTLGYLIRNTSANAARFSESFLGRYGNFQKVAKDVLYKNPHSFGLLGTSIYNLIGDESWKNMVYGRENSPLNVNLPTSQDLKKVTEGLTGEYLKPKTKNEGRVQEFTSDVGSLGRSLGGGARNILVNNLGIPAAANVAKEVVKELGFGDEAANWTKLAAWTGLSLLGNVNAATHAARLMNEGRDGFGPNVAANIPRYNASINQASRDMLHGDPRSQLAQQQIAGIQNDIQNGQTTMRDLMNRYDAINAAKRDRGLFQLGRNDRNAAIRNINRVRDSVRDEINHLGRSNPQALESWRNGVQAFSTIHQSNAITNWIRRVMGDPFAKTATASLFGMGALKSPLISGSLSGVVPALYKGGQVAYRVWNNPVLARYYWNAINAARQQNQGAFIKNAHDLEKSYEKMYKKSNITNVVNNDEPNKSKKNSK